MHGTEKLTCSIQKSKFEVTLSACNIPAPIRFNTTLHALSLPFGGGPLNFPLA